MSGTKLLALREYAGVIKIQNVEGDRSFGYALAAHPVQRPSN